MDLFDSLLRSAMVEHGLRNMTLDGNQNINNSSTTSEVSTSNSNSTINYRLRRREEKWVQKCVSNFSLYATIVSNNCDDPYEEAAAIEAGEFKQKMSKSAKKRLRKQRKAKKLKDKMHGPRAAQMKELNLALAKLSKKQTKKDIKLMINKLSNLPL